MLGLVRAVGVHLDDGVVPGVEGPAEALEVRRAQALLLGPVDDVDLRVLRGEGVGDRAGPVGRAVVEDDDVDVRHLVPDATDHDRQRVVLVVGRDEDGDAPQRRSYGLRQRGGPRGLGRVVRKP